MYRKILIKGNNAKYVEKRGNGNVASDREITMEGDNAQYEELAGAAATHMPLYRTREQGTNLYEFLVRGGYIDGKTDRECWLYLMGCTAEQPSELNPIRWLHTKEQLRHMLSLFFGGMLKDGSLKLADLTKQVPKMFIDKNGNAIELSKPRKEVSGEMDDLTTFFRPISDL